MAQTQGGTCDDGRTRQTSALTALDAPNSKLWKRGYKCDKDDPQATLSSSMRELEAVVNGRLKKVKDFRSDD